MAAQGVGDKGRLPWLLGAVLLLSAEFLAPRSACANGGVTTQRPLATLYTLSNGLTVVLEEDHRQPIVAMRVSYAVGARDDPKDKLGLAHLVEHLTFRGSRHVADGQGMALLERAGTGDANGSTGLDSTCYTTTVATGALELALWLESERMAFTAERFDARSLLVEQRIVREEEALHENQDIALSRVLFDAIFGRQHPYGSTPGRGSWVTDLSLDDARAFFVAGYRPDNARLVLVGDFDAAAVRALITRYFGAIRNPSGLKARALAPPVAREAHHVVMRGRSSVDEVAMGWPISLANLRDHARAELLTRLASAELQQRALSKTRVTTWLKLGLESLELGPLCVVWARLAPGAEPSQIPPKISEEFQRIAQQIAPIELERVRRQAVIHWLTQWENLGQRAAEQEQMLRLLGRPIAASEYVHALQSVTAEELAGLARAYDPKLVSVVDSVSGYGRARAAVSAGAR